MPYRQAVIGYWLPESCFHLPIVWDGRASSSDWEKIFFIEISNLLIYQVGVDGAKQRSALTSSSIFFKGESNIVTAKTEGIG